MSVLLFGASPLGARALVRMDIDYHVVVQPREDLTVLSGQPLSVTYLPFGQDALSALAFSCPGDVDAVVSFTEPGLLPAALVAEASGLFGTSVTGVAATRNKLAMRSRLRGVTRQPRFGQVGADPVPSDIKSVVVKPLSGTAGVGVELVPAAMVTESASVGRPQGPLVLWEEYLSGPELSIETVSRTADGKLEIDVLGITAKQTSGVPHFVELGHKVPAGLTDSVMREVVEVVCRCLEALDVRLGAAHTELILSDDGPVLLEVQTRPGGGRIPMLHELVAGVDHYEAALRALLELPRPSARPGEQVAMAQMLMKQPRHSDPHLVIDQISGGVGAQARIVDLELWTPPTNASESARSNLDRHGVLVAAGGDAATVQAALDRATAELFTTRHHTKEETNV